MKETWVLEYSKSQQAFHIQMLEESVEANQRRFFHRPKDTFDWIIIFSGSQRQCELMLMQCERKLEKTMEAHAWTH